MRRAIIFLILLLLMSGIAFLIFAAYSNHQQVAELTDLNSTARYLDANGNFSGKFKHTDENIKIKDFSYEVIDDDLYITVYVGVGTDSMEYDENGYVLIEISGLPDIDKVFYADGDKNSVLPTDRN